jgi:ArsR family transcriptional regulator
MSPEQRPPIFDRMSTLSDPTRGRLLALLERRELAVSELCAVVQLPQSTVSRHLKVLTDDGWLVARRDGVSRRYRMEPESLRGTARPLWQLAREQIAATDAARQDRERLTSVLAAQRTRSREFFSSAAGQWDKLRRDLFGMHSEVPALLGLLDGDWTVGDLGCGTGRMARALAPFVARVIAVDPSAQMLDSARGRLADLDNVEVREGELEALPIADGALDAAVLLLVLHHVVDPGEALAEVARALKPGGRLLIVDMQPHEREEYRQEMGHLWLGLPASQLERWLADAGFEAVRLRPLPPDPQAKGPVLFAATSRRRAVVGELPAAGDRFDTTSEPGSKASGLDEVSRPAAALRGGLL